MTLKKTCGKIYLNLFNSLKGTGLSKHTTLLKIHVFLTRQLKSEYVDLYGLKFYLGKNDEGNYSSENFYKDYYFDLLENEISKGDNVIDIGAKIGIYSLAFCKFVGDTGNVFLLNLLRKALKYYKK